MAGSYRKLLFLNSSGVVWMKKHLMGFQSKNFVFKYLGVF